jgi:hypothetical protein
LHLVLDPSASVDGIEPCDMHFKGMNTSFMQWGYPSTSTGDGRGWS